MSPSQKRFAQLARTNSKSWAIKYFLIEDPWREAFFGFIAQNPGATFHYAVTSDGGHIVYCREKDKGIWFIPGTGKGPLQERGRQTMRQMIERHH